MEAVKKSLLTFSIIVVAFVGFYWGSISLSLSALQSAVRERNVVQLEKYVDWKQVREQLRSDMRAYMNAEFIKEMTGENGKSNALGAMLVGAIGPAIIDRFIDSFVTPQGFVAILNGKLNQKDVPAIAPSIPKNSVVLDQRLSSFDEYTLIFAKNGSTNEEARVILRRYGLIWRVAAISFTPNERHTAAAQNGHQPSSVRASATEINAGLEITLTPKRSATALIVDGDISNAAAEPRRVPPVRVSLRDGNHNDLGVSRTIAPPVEQLAAGQHTHFSTVFEQPSTVAKGVAATFVSE